MRVFIVLMLILYPLSVVFAGSPELPGGALPNNDGSSLQSEVPVDPQTREILRKQMHEGADLLKSVAKQLVAAPPSEFRTYFLNHYIKLPTLLEIQAGRGWLKIKNEGACPKILERLDLGFEALKHDAQESFERQHGLETVAIDIYLGRDPQNSNSEQMNKDALKALKAVFPEIYCATAYVNKTFDPSEAPNPENEKRDIHMNCGLPVIEGEYDGPTITVTYTPNRMKIETINSRDFPKRPPMRDAGLIEFRTEGKAKGWYSTWFYVHTITEGDLYQTRNTLSELRAFGTGGIESLTDKASWSERAQYLFGKASSRFIDVLGGTGKTILSKGLNPLPGISLDLSSPEKLPYARLSYIADRIPAGCLADTMIETPETDIAPPNETDIRDAKNVPQMPDDEIDLENKLQMSLPKASAESPR